MDKPAETCLCGHSVAEHGDASVCQTVVHYPSEDYPCLCTGLVQGEGEECGECGHPDGMHATMTRCRPQSGEMCACVRLRPA